MHQKTLSDILYDPRRREPCALKEQGGIRESRESGRRGQFRVCTGWCMIQASISSSIPQCQWREGKRQRRGEALGNTPLSLFALLPLSLFSVSPNLSLLLSRPKEERSLSSILIFFAVCAPVSFFAKLCVLASLASCSEGHTQ